MYFRLMLHDVRVSSTRMLVEYLQDFSTHPTILMYVISI